MASSKSRKRGAAAVDEAELKSRRETLKKKGKREFVTPDLLDDSSKLNFLQTKQHCKIVRDVYNY